MNRTRLPRAVRWGNLKRIREVFTCCRETRQWLAVTLAYLGLRSLSYPCELRLRSGEVLTLKERMDLIIFWLIFMHRHYPVQRLDRVIVDVGANIGLFTLYAAREAPEAHIVTIEPFPATCRSLMELVDRNRLGDRVTVLNCAVAGSSGVGAMDCAPQMPSQYRRVYSSTTVGLNANHRGDAGNAQPGDGVIVRTVTLAQALDSAKVTNADFVKMNIHGSEYEVLMSTPASALRRLKRIAVQYHDLSAEAKIGKNELFEHLRGIGFRLESDRDTRRGAGLAVFTACA